ncbi:MAG TPA: hypothetical protein VFL61_06230 [Gaiellaceae bacterium]|nr:hypothetical protein [Gaiellaceae bacterium]
MSLDWWIWATFVAFVLYLLALDLLVLHRKAHTVTIRGVASGSRSPVGSGR